MNKKVVLSLIAVAVIALLSWKFLFKSDELSGADVTAKVKKGRFDVVISVTGELRAKTQTDIMAPMGLRSARIYQIKINDLVPEGSIVKEGDYVCTLDKTEVMNKLNEELLEAQIKQSEYNQTQLDTAIELREARDEVENFKFELKQKKLELEQSAFEAPSIKQQVQNDYERAERTLRQKEETLLNKIAQAEARMNIVASDLAKAKNSLKKYEDLLSQLTITAPKEGMIIYAKEWNGRKRVVGSTINVWDPDVANLPDLRDMEVISYVNEVDIQKVKVGQKVDIGLDADPNKELKGRVKTVASIGEQRPNQNSKVFEVVITVLSKDSTLRPSMTTSCNILYGGEDDALTVPVEAINVADSKSYVYKKEGGSIVRQQVYVAATNNKDAHIKYGLKENEIVVLKDMSDTATLKWNLLPDSLLKPPVDTATKKEEKKVPRSGGGGSDVIIIEG
jgi:RND family efflux transporter MFP subunit